MGLFHCLFDYLVQIAPVDNNVLLTKSGRDDGSQVVRADETVTVTVVYFERDCEVMWCEKSGWDQQ